MANEKLHLVHVKSSQIGKAPSASTLNYGEIAVNYNSDTPSLYIKDNQDNIVKFQSGPYRPRMFYGTCGTAAGTGEKAVVCSAFTAEDLTKGVIIYVTFDNTSTAAVSATTMSVNETVAHKVKKIKNGAIANLDYASEITENMTQGFVYTGEYWVVLGVDKDANTTYTESKLRRETGGYIADSKVYRYQMLFQMMDEQRVTPLNNNSNVTGNSKAMLTNVEFNPFGYIYYYATTTSANTNTTISAAQFYYTYGSNINLRYTFNSVSLTTNKSVYLEVIPQSNGSVKLASSTPLTQTLPTAETSNWFILLGMATSSYQLNLYPDHPVYTHNGTEIVELLNPKIMAGIKAETEVTVDTALDTGSTNPLANSAITTYIYDIEKVTSAALNDLNSRKADKSYVDDAISSITIDVDSELDSASTNPVENRAIWEVIVENEEVISSAFNDLETRKADKSYVDVAVSSITIDVDMELDSGSTNPVANSAITKVISEDEKVISAAFNDLESRKADKSYVDDAVSSITIDVDSELDTGSTNPVANSAITTYIYDIEEVASAALNDLETRKADKSYVDNAVSSITIDVDSELDSGSTNPVENQVIWSAITEFEFITSTALNDLNDRVGDLEDELSDDVEMKSNKINNISYASISTASTTNYPTAKAVYDEIHPKVKTSMPSGGFEPNVFYRLGTLTGNVTFTFHSAYDSSIANEWMFQFSTTSPTPNITWPSQITGWLNGLTPVIHTNKTYQVSVLNGLGVLAEF